MSDESVQASAPAHETAHVNADCVAPVFWIVSNSRKYIEPSGPPEYKLGWQDGCDSGLSSQGGMLMKMAYGFKKRPEMGDNELYKTAWNEGFSYCRFSLDPVDKSNWYN